MALLMTACLLALFSGRQVTGYTLLIVPIAVQEMVLAVWLLVKGFNPSPQMPRAWSDTSPRLSTSSADDCETDPVGVREGRTRPEYNPR